MEKQSKNKFINKALFTLGLKWNSDEFNCDSLKEINAFISHQKMLQHEQLDLIETAKENLEIIKHNIEMAESIISQSEIEEYKRLNPKAKGIYKF